MYQLEMAAYEEKGYSGLREKRISKQSGNIKSRQKKSTVASGRLIEYYLASSWDVLLAKRNEQVDQSSKLL